MQPKRIFFHPENEKHRFDTADLDYNEFVVTENGELIGFGRIRKIGAIYEVGCIVVVEEKKGEGRKTDPCASSGICPSREYTQ
jgi:hypothetical protein